MRIELLSVNTLNKVMEINKDNISNILLILTIIKLYLSNPITRAYTHTHSPTHSHALTQRALEAKRVD